MSSDSKRDSNTCTTYKMLVFGIWFLFLYKSSATRIRHDIVYGATDNKNFLQNYIVFDNKLTKKIWN